MPPGPSGPSIVFHGPRKQEKRSSDLPLFALERIELLEEELEAAAIFLAVELFLAGQEGRLDHIALAGKGRMAVPARLRARPA